MLGRVPACALRCLPLLFLLGGLHQSLAQSAPIEISASERSLAVGTYAAERLGVWQKRLNLQLWDISVVVSRDSELRPKTLGNIHWDRAKKTAVIRVLDPADYNMPFEAMLKDLEFTVVHELIHLEMSPVLSDLQRTDANRMEEEHAVNQMADALLKLDHRR